MPDLQHNAQWLPANTWSPRDAASLVERLGGAIVATHSQSGIQGLHMTRILKEDGKLGLLKGLITVEGSCDLGLAGLSAADFDNIPYLAFKGDYTVTSALCVNAVACHQCAAGHGSRNRKGGLHPVG